MTVAPPATHAWTLRRRLSTTSVAVGLVVVLLAVAVFVSALLFSRAGNTVIYRWQPAIVASNQVLTDLVDQETGVRGYVLSDDPRFLEPYRIYRAEERRDLARLDRLVGSDDEIRARIAALRAAITTWHDGIAVPAIAAGGRGDSDAARRVVESVTAKQRFDALRREAAAVVAIIEDRTADSRAERTRDGQVFAVAGGLALVLVLAAGVLIVRGLDRWVLAPVESLADQTRRVASGAKTEPIVPAGPREVSALAADVEAMRQQIVDELARTERAAEQLRRRTDELERSNEDLQQFAYVASHDLSEPLRKVANFCQLLERQYNDQLDDRGRQYIAFAVDGAKRMQALISDLLSLSRVGRTTDSFEELPGARILELAIANLGERIEVANATIESVTELPTLSGDRSLLISLFENLIGNAVKYRRPDVDPVVRISAERGPDDGMWTFTVSDNGIGIDAEYADRIFVVFQRLHLRDEYGGTGIGLALCRRIVEFHGGRIWLAAVTSPGRAGATFRFTLPEVPLAESRH